MKKKIWKLACLFLLVMITSGAIKPVQADAASKSSLLKKIQSKTSEPVIKAYYADFDGDGQKELFAAVGEGSYEGCATEIWFAGSKEVKRLHEYTDGDIYAVDGSPGTICTVNKKQKLFVVNGGVYGSVSWSKCWYVKSGRVQKVNVYGLGGLTQISGKDFRIVHDAFDAVYQGQSWSGHTYKPYFIRWTGKKFTEYQAKEITVDKFKQYEGSENVLRKIRQTGYQVTTIYQRSNKLIHLNVEKDIADGKAYDNVTLKVKKNQVSVVTADDANTKDTDIIKKSSYGGVYWASGFKG